MRILLFIVILSVQAFSSAGQVVGKLFPNMPTSTAQDVAITLPDDVKGKYTLLVIAYSRKSEQELQTWLMPIFEKFVQKTTGLMASFTYDVNVYFVPMFTGMNAMATQSAKQQTLNQVDARLLPYILFYKGKLETYKEKLGFDKRDTPYIFVLDPEGQVVRTVSGPYEEHKMDAIEAVIE